MTSSIQDLPKDMIVEIFNYVRNPSVLCCLNREMKGVVDSLSDFFYRPIYLQFVAIERVDLNTFERERGINDQLTTAKKVQRTWKVLNFYRKHIGLSRVLFQHKADDVVQLYQKGHLELQSALIFSRSIFWCALGGSITVENPHDPIELKRGLRKWMHEHCNPKSKVLKLFQRLHKIPPEMAFFQSVKTIRVSGISSKEMIKQLRTFKQQGIIPWTACIERVEFEAMKMVISFNM